jgi:hypothetical protein
MIHVAAVNVTRHVATVLEWTMHAWFMRTGRARAPSGAHWLVAQLHPPAPPTSVGWPRIEFKNHDKQYRAPFVVYADFEALTVPVSTDKPNDPTQSYTNAYQTHEPCGYCVHIVSSDPARTFKPFSHRPVYATGDSPRKKYRAA